MDPIRGVVINEKQIELKGGTVITPEGMDGFPLGAKVLVCFDFCNMEPRRIWLARSVYPGASESEEFDDGVVEEGICLEHDEIDEICR